MSKEFILHKEPSKQLAITSNNRKLTMGRYIMAEKIQSVPIFGEWNKLIGFKYITHKK